MDFYEFGFQSRSFLLTMVFVKIDFNSYIFPAPERVKMQCDEKRWRKYIGSSTPTCDTSENVPLFVSISSFVSFGVCNYMEYFWELKEDQKFMTGELVLNFEQWKTFSKNCKPMANNNIKPKLFLWT